VTRHAGGQAYLGQACWGLGMLRSMHRRVPAEAACQADYVCWRAAHVLAAALPVAALGSCWPLWTLCELQSWVSLP